MQTFEEKHLYRLHDKVVLPNGLVTMVPKFSVFFPWTQLLSQLLFPWLLAFYLAGACKGREGVLSSRVS